MPATTIRQAKMMRVVYAARKGTISPDKLTGAAKKVYDSSITDSELKDFTKVAMPEAYKYASPLLLKPVVGVAKGLAKWVLPKGKLNIGSGLLSWQKLNIIKGVPKGIGGALSLGKVKPF